MAVAENVTIIDGQTYNPGDTLPDFGSIVCISSEGNKRNYEGLLSDASKLPTYVDSGSSALLYDGTGNTEVYHFINGQWYKL